MSKYILGTKIPRSWEDVGSDIVEVIQEQRIEEYEAHVGLLQSMLKSARGRIDELEHSLHNQRI